MMMMMMMMMMVTMMMMTPSFFIFSMRIQICVFAQIGTRAMQSFPATGGFVLATVLQGNTIGSALPPIRAPYTS